VRNIGTIYAVEVEPDGTRVAVADVRSHGAGSGGTPDPENRKSRARDVAEKNERMKVSVRANGPYLLMGPIDVVDSVGVSHHIADGERVMLCRCGQSRTKPWCDAKPNACGIPSRRPLPDEV